MASMFAFCLVKMSQYLIVKPRPSYAIGVAKVGEETKAVLAMYCNIYIEC